MAKLWFIILFLFFLSACQGTKETITKSNSAGYVDISIFKRPQISDQTHRVRNIRYQLIFNLSAKSYFEVEADINFQLTSTDAAVTLELFNFDITRTVINGKEVFPDYDGKRLKIDGSLLKSGENIVELIYNGKYKKQGNGLNYWQDPNDNNIYLYSQFKAQQANTLFPVFQQTGTLAKFKLLVLAPFNWQVISVTRETKVPKIIPRGEDDYRKKNLQELWHFPESLPMKPEHVGLFAGPFVQWEVNKESTPLRFLAPRSIAKQADIKTKVSTWLEETKQHLDHLKIYLKTDYPFNKYDQIWLPTNLRQYEEATTTILYNNKNLLDEPNNYRQQIIVNALAEQWFGHLVNSSNWRYQWLNTSLSQYVSKIILKQNYDQDIWFDFFFTYKPISYNQDKLNEDNLQTSTDKNNLAPASEQQIKTIKGIALLKQLNFVIGDKKFRSILTDYLNTFKYSSSSPVAFLSGLDKANIQGFNQWQQHWLQTPGINQIGVEYTCKNRVVKKLTLLQHSDNPNLLKKQKVKLAMLDRDAKGLLLKNQLTVTYQGKETEINQLNDTVCPDLVFPNYQDYGYVEVNLTSKMIKNVATNLNNIDDPMLSLMIWRSLWQSVLNGNLSAKDYLSLVLINLPYEKNLATNKQISHDLREFWAYLLSWPLLDSQLDFINKAMNAITELSVQKVIEGKNKPQIQQVWLNAYIDFSSKTDNLTHLAYLLKSYDKHLPPLTQDQRWRIVKQLNRYNYPKAANFIRDEAKRDPSSAGKLEKLLSYVVRPIASEKRHTLSSLNRLSPHIQQQVMANLYPPEQGFLREASLDERLDFVKTALNTQSTSLFMENYSKYLTPSTCLKTVRDALNAILKGSLPATIRHNIEQKRLEIKYCINLKQHLE